MSLNDDRKEGTWIETEVADRHVELVWLKEFVDVLFLFDSIVP